MRKETDWAILSNIFTQRGVCIKPNGINREKATADFEAGRTQYYTFPLVPSEHTRKGDRGYIRTIYNADLKGVFVDFVSPYSDPNVPRALLSLAHNLPEGIDLYISNSNLPQKLKGREESVREIEGKIIGPELNYKLYCSGNTTMVKLPK